MAIVGLVESLLTAKIVDDATDTYSSKNRESRGQGIANMITGLFGGMGRLCHDWTIQCQIRCKQ